jgi:hypothetical protein
MEKKELEDKVLETDDNYRFENWYEGIKDETFPTIFADLELDEAKGLMKYR